MKLSHKSHIRWTKQNLYLLLATSNSYRIDYELFKVIRYIFGFYMISSHTKLLTNIIHFAFKWGNTMQICSFHELCDWRDQNRMRIRNATDKIHLEFNSQKLAQASPFIRTLLFNSVVRWAKIKMEITIENVTVNSVWDGFYWSNGRTWLN